MQEIYTTELIRFYYHETTQAENRAIVNRLQQEPEYLEAWENLKLTLSELQECELDPNPTSVNIILEYAHRGVVSA